MEATGTAGNLSGLAPKGTAEPAVMVATGWRLPVAFTRSEFLWACAGGTAEFAVKESADGGPSIFCEPDTAGNFSGLALVGAAECASEVAGREPAAFEDKGDKRSDGEPPVVCGARAFRPGGTAPSFSGLTPKGAAECAAKVATDGKPSFSGTGAGAEAGSGVPFELRMWEFSGSFFAHEE
jgi:hypothetical protein